METGRSTKTQTLDQITNANFLCIKDYYYDFQCTVYVAASKKKQKGALTSNHTEIYQRITLNKLQSVRIHTSTHTSPDRPSGAFSLAAKLNTNHLSHES